MSYEIKQSSTQAPLLFLMVLSSDHITGATGLTPSVTISKSGGSFASPAGTVSEVGNGWYKVAANATDTNTLGPIALHASVATADPFDLVVANIVGYDPQVNPGTQQMVESYAASTVVPTRDQALMMILQALLGFSWTGALQTIFKRDNTTTAMVVTANASANASAATQTT